MTIERREPSGQGTKLPHSPYLAKVVGYVDASYMGNLRVVLMRHQGNKLVEYGQSLIVRYASPFYGVTSLEHVGVNTAEKTDGATGFNDTQKSYGMWFVPPDLGVFVLCFFVNGNPAEGYWMGCVPNRGMNHMIPAIGGSLNVDISAADKKKYSTNQPLPVAEYNRDLFDKALGTRIDLAKKPVHPIADRFLEQGLLDDDVRGTAPSTARRDIPGMVFGISTPGPLDQTGKKAFIKNSATQTSKPIPVSRLGGTQIVMDDGNEQYIRKTPASTGGQEYADTLKQETGEPNIPYSEYFRIRTRTGHQLLFHNSEDLIYIGNARGTTWIEMTSNGKIDIFADDSISIHTQNDLNIRADRDINLEAGRNINMRSASGRVQIDVATDFNLTVGSNGKIAVKGDYETVVDNNTKVVTAGNFNLRTDGDNKFTAAANTHIRSGDRHFETANRIDMNGPIADKAETAEPVIPIPLRTNFATDVTKGWEARYQAQGLDSIMRRVPMHEPWAGHENFAPQIFSKQNTDRDSE